MPTATPSHVRKPSDSINQSGAAVKSSLEGGKSISAAVEPRPTNPPSQMAGSRPLVPPQKAANHHQVPQVSQMSQVRRYQTSQSLPSANDLACRPLQNTCGVPLCVDAIVNDRREIITIQPYENQTRQPNRVYHSAAATTTRPAQQGFHPSYHSSTIGRPNTTGTPTWVPMSTSQSGYLPAPNKRLFELRNHNKSAGLDSSYSVVSQCSATDHPTGQLASHTQSTSSLHKYDKINQRRPKNHNHHNPSHNRRHRSFDVDKTGSVVEGRQVDQSKYNKVLQRSESQQPQSFIQTIQTFFRQVFWRP